MRVMRREMPCGMCHTKKLKYAAEKVFQRTVIALDLTASERQHDKELRGGLREGWFISNAELKHGCFLQSVD